MREDLPARRIDKVDTRPLKRLVIEKFPRDSPLRVILAERDTLQAEEFLAKLETWLLLLKEGCDGYKILEKF
ncbi:MAG: hypothetical protein QXL77_06630 [Candidatus Bathyarchaeia archaeon]